MKAGSRLQRIQRVIARAYDLHLLPDVEQFVCGPDLVRATAGEGFEHRGEVLVVLEDDEGVHVGLYLAPEVLARLSASNPDFRSVCLATEGVSHFIYLSFRADNEQQVTQLELELQAEVDKYAANLFDAHGADALSGNGVGALRARSRALRQRLFSGVRFLDPPNSTEGERYRVAHHAAARYVAFLEARFVDRGRVDELRTELRRFYRLGGRQKLERAGAT